MRSESNKTNPGHRNLIEVKLSLQQLVAELQRIDILIQQAVQRWQLAGQNPLDAFRGLYVSDAEAIALLERPFSSNWGNTAIQNTEVGQTFHQVEEQAALQARAIGEAARCQGYPTRLDRLSEIFQLDPFDIDALLICLAPTLDLRYEKLYGYLQDDITRKRPGVNLVLDLLCTAGPERLYQLAHFTDDAPLIKYHLLERMTEPGQPKAPLLSQTLSVDETIVHWLLGSYQPQGDLAHLLSLTVLDMNKADEILAGSVGSLFNQSDMENCHFIFFGADQLGQEAAARRCAVRSKRSLLALDLAIVAERGLPIIPAIQRALRDAKLAGAIPFLKGWDACLADGVPFNGALTEVCQFAGAWIISAKTAWQPQGVERNIRLLQVEFPVPAYSQRITLWTHFLNAAGIQEAVDIPTLAGQFALTASQIRDAVALIRDSRNSHKNPLTMEDFMAGARTSSTSRLAALAHKITPRYGWEDIILPEDQVAQLREIIATVRGRATVLDEWGVGRKLASSRGITALFAGPPGTGKTMAAEIIAGELGLDLYKIDLSVIVSKYIGETEKNLEQIFTEAASSNAILFFDEADALFGKRSEVRDSHDRYANIEISYLLQRMEAYDGITILATNLRANLDEAFTRRLQFSVEFPFPEEADRLHIWQTLFPIGVPRAPNLDLPSLAQRFKLAGGSIRNILVGAAYLAASDGRRVTMEHLLHGAQRELQKMGRLMEEC